MKGARWGGAEVCGVQSLLGPHRYGLGTFSIGTSETGNEGGGGSTPGMQTPLRSPWGPSQGGKQKPQPMVSSTASPGAPARRLTRSTPTSAVAEGVVRNAESESSATSSAGGSFRGEEASM